MIEMASENTNKMRQNSDSSRVRALGNKLTGFVAPLGYEIIHLEVQSGRQKVLRIFIDHNPPRPQERIGVEDCAKVSRALDDPFETDEELQSQFSGQYELEVSSPGIQRPLSRLEDFIRFEGQRTRVQLFRALSAEEINNPEYLEKNPKQKNFVGFLAGEENGKIKLTIHEVEKSKKRSKKASASEDPVNVWIPIQLISKAHLEPELEISEGDF